MPGTEQVCRERIVLDTEIAKYLYKADELLEKLKKLAPVSNPTTIHNFTPFGYTDKADHEEARRIVGLELGPQEDSMRQD